MKPRRLVIISFGLLLSGFLLIAGCGGSGGSAPSGGTQATGAAGDSTDQAIKTIQINETSFNLDPKDITLDKAGTYVFVAKNSADIVHALEIDGQGIEEETENIPAGETARLTVDLKPGTYELYCPIDGHRDRGMEGLVKVAVKGGAQSTGGSGDGSDDSGGGGY